MWIAVCTCGSGMMADSQAEVSDMAQAHLIVAPTPSGASEPWKHSVHLGESVNSCRLRPHFDNGEEPAPAAPSKASNGSSAARAKPGTMGPAELMRFLKAQELKFAADDEEIDGPKPEPRKNPYTVDPEPGVDNGFSEDSAGWGGPGEPPVDINPVDAPTSLDELPEGIILDGQEGTGPKLEPLYEDGPDYALDDSIKKPVWPENKR